MTASGTGGAHSGTRWLRSSGALLMGSISSFRPPSRPATGTRFADLAGWSAEAGAVSFNVYFVVPTGRAEFMQGMSPEENDDVLRELVELEGTYRGRMMVRSKCQPQIMRHVVQGDPESPLLNYETRCPCGVHYVRITPEGKVTPCPYMPVVAGDLLTQSFQEIWESSPVFTRLRSGKLGGPCGRCEYREVCGGCRARAYADSGDFMGPDDSCAYEPSGEIPLIASRRSVSYGQSGSDGPGGRRGRRGLHRASRVGGPPVVAGSAPPYRQRTELRSRSGHGKGRKIRP